MVFFRLAERDLGGAGGAGRCFGRILDWGDEAVLTFLAPALYYLPEYL